MEERQLDRLSAVCGLALGKKGNPFMSYENGKDTLMEWSQDEEKPIEFRMLCSTLAQVGKFAEVKRHAKYQVIENDVIIAVGEAKYLAEKFGISSKEVRLFAREKKEYQGKIFKEVKDVERL